MGRDHAQAPSAPRLPPSPPQTSDGGGAVPPAYATVGDPSPTPSGDGVDTTAAFSNLSLSNSPMHPTTDTCLAHLKLLAAFQTLKEDIGYTDGLWGIWDDPVFHDNKQDDKGNASVETTENGGTGASDGSSAPGSPAQVISKAREKRWAVFIARAVDRYETWWRAAMKSEPLCEGHMREPLGAKYENFPTGGQAPNWSARELPPLDVLMIWHAHMLNPRAFLEDMIRCGAREYWSAGMPWRLVNAAIDANLSYNVSDATKASWVELTGCNWDNIEDPKVKELLCPVCATPAEIKWTTCGVDENANQRNITDAAQLIGKGYGDGEFSHECHACGIVINKELLSAAKFVRDTKALLHKAHPLPGTILDPATGTPRLEPTKVDSHRSYPNRLVKNGARADILELLRPRPRGGGGATATPQQHQPSMDDVRAALERAMADPARHLEATGRRRAATGARPAVRRVMRRYWRNLSPFALDLAGAALRQSAFSAKMVRLDWLHSPTARATMERFGAKYARFFAILAAFPRNVAVPTLDVDLVWHTHQLSPSAYYAYSMRMTDKFIDHDDKIDDGKLSAAFAWTSATYQLKYGEVYSECTSVRTSHINPIGKLLGLSKNEQISEKFHTSGRAKLCPPDNSAHISAHNAVRIVGADERREKILRHARARHESVLEANYAKAAKRAEQKGRQLPPRQDYYSHWGYSYYMYSPYIYPIYISPEIYCGWDPSTVVAGQGQYGNCCQGTCGSAAGGGCATAEAGCGSADAASGGFDSASGGLDFGGSGGDGCGGGGGGCGGGGGGGCGGGGGGS